LVANTIKEQEVTVTRDAAIASIEAYFDNDTFFDDLSRRVAIRTESQDPNRKPDLQSYLADEMSPYLEAMGFECDIFDNPVAYGGPFLIAERFEGEDLPTVLTYGHGDVVPGYDAQWKEGLSPWDLIKRDERWYGRGTADNKGQHTINMAALKSVLETRGKLGFNIKMLLETSEEIGSPGLNEFAKIHQDQLKADVLVASDGPRLSPGRPTLFMGSRGAFNFTMSLNLREGGHHSGNWGGLLANPGIILSHAIASMVSSKGEVLLDGIRSPEPLPNSVRAAITDLQVDGGEGAPEIDHYWGESGFTSGEKVFGCNTFEVLSFITGNPGNPVNAVPPRAEAVCHIRFIPPSDPNTFMSAIRQHLDQNGFSKIELEQEKTVMNATRLDPDHPWVQWASHSITATTGSNVDILPNLGGSLPNEVFADTLGMPTIWVPHSYAACSQHAPNEHILPDVSRDALRLMTGIWWDMGDGNTPNN
jgi:acetylornithine deacetylase/succinyl-diaminopimelate desuccinylase-like protein